MKSPWQFISDLANRRRQRLAEQSFDPTAADRPDRRVLPAPSERSEDVATSVVTESQPGKSSRPLVEMLQAEMPIRTEGSPVNSVGDSREDDRATSVAPETSIATQAAIMPKKKGLAPRATKPASRHKPDVTPTSDRMPENLRVECTFHDDVRLVDDDIKRLRAELAAKLRVQNEQLKKMLERFDRR